VLLDACAVLRNRDVPFHCTIIGTGDQELELRRRAAAHALGEFVEFAGALPQARVIERLERAAVFAGAYVVGEDGNRDGLPTVLLEAMALGTPCVASDVTGVVEVVRDGRTGLLVRERDHEGLASAIERVLGENELRTRLAQQARRLVETNFDVLTNTADMREMFADAIDRPRRLEVAL
jgi:glycosyltransferase involved in cell wall biosynthesis